MSDYTNCDHTKSSYNKTGKKVKCIGSKRVDLTYKKVYDVFTDKNGYEFLIDEAGDRRYESMEFPMWCEVFDDDDYSRFEVVEQKHKFKVGDVVKVTSTDYIRQFNKSIKVGDIGNIINIINNGFDPYQVKFNETDKYCWCFTDKCIELVNDDLENTPTKSESVVVRKFKVGDTVRVTSIDNIHEHTETFKVGDIEVIIDVDDDDYDEVPYQIRNWWFSESDLELVTNDNSKTPIKSDGGSSSYYVKKIPPQMLDDFNSKGVIEAKDVMRLFLGNDFNMSNVFKAYCRVISLRNGEGKDGVTELYDLNKAVFFAQDELNNYLKSQPNGGSNE